MLAAWKMDWGGGLRKEEVSRKWKSVDKCQMLWKNEEGEGKEGFGFIIWKVHCFLCENSFKRAVDNRQTAVD